jgi:hypothetical protein
MHPSKHAPHGNKGSTNGCSLDEIVITSCNKIEEILEHLREHTARNSPRQKPSIYRQDRSVYPRPPPKVERFISRKDQNPEESSSSDGSYRPQDNESTAESEDYSDTGEELPGRTDDDSDTGEELPERTDDDSDTGEQEHRYNRSSGYKARRVEGSYKKRN